MGKIAFFHTGKFAEYITIATEDGCVAVISQVFIESDLDYRTETDVLSETLALHYIENQQYIREELEKLGVFNVEKYKEKQLEEEQKRKEKARLVNVKGFNVHEYHKKILY